MGFRIIFKRHCRVLKLKLEEDAQKCADSIKMVKVKMSGFRHPANTINNANTVNGINNKRENNSNDINIQKNNEYTSKIAIIDNVTKKIKNNSNDVTVDNVIDESNAITITETTNNTLSKNNDYKYLLSSHIGRYEWSNIHFHEINSRNHLNDEDINDSNEETNNFFDKFNHLFENNILKKDINDSNLNKVKKRKNTNLDNTNNTDSSSKNKISDANIRKQSSGDDDTKDKNAASNFNNLINKVFSRTDNIKENSGIKIENIRPLESIKWKNPCRLFHKMKEKSSDKNINLEQKIDKSVNHNDNADNDSIQNEYRTLDPMTLIQGDLVNDILSLVEVPSASSTNSLIYASPLTNIEEDDSAGGSTIHEKNNNTQDSDPTPSDWEWYLERVRDHIQSRNDKIEKFKRNFKRMKEVIAINIFYDG
ncbi:hypothetical protein NCAS_0B04610 [Naumovozyma castellii]|uniref:Uncharacterized protein n=1 Tax=Naumovozyma castellii TaxID=27288 RepID=G0VAL9_NAUCA|nr:hypothetical protein NCAS_0B04610 [Naumovozyma castellii CBS 4309]CCC68545.1 hypothetical protein NCAS_0B04610 [Naumovozyma castellii CBS 4309]